MFITYSFYYTLYLTCSRPFGRLKVTTDYKLDSYKCETFVYMIKEVGASGNISSDVKIQLRCMF